MPSITIRDFHDSDAASVKQVALAAFDQFKDRYADWPAMSARLSRMSALADAGEIVVAALGDRVVGAVAYIPPISPKAAYFPPTWPVIRMLVVDPSCRGMGIGRALTEQCIVRARRDRSAVIALHTSPIMSVALAMYRRMGFERSHEAPPIHGVPYSVYAKNLEAHRVEVG